jgi:hypothetical protein
MGTAHRLPLFICDVDNATTHSVGVPDRDTAEYWEMRRNLNSCLVG